MQSTEQRAPGHCSRRRRRGGRRALPAGHLVEEDGEAAGGAVVGVGEGGDELGLDDGAAEVLGGGRGGGIGDDRKAQEQSCEALNGSEGHMDHHMARMGALNTCNILNVYKDVGKNRWSKLWGFTAAIRSAMRPWNILDS